MFEISVESSLVHKEKTSLLHLQWSLQMGKNHFLTPDLYILNLNMIPRARAVIKIYSFSVAMVVIELTKIVRITCGMPFPDLLLTLC